MSSLGIMQETKNCWECRVPLNPGAVRKLTDLGHRVIVQPSETRTYKNEAYIEAGAEIGEDLSGCDLIIGVKEIPIKDIIPGKPHLFFSHTIKGQDYNMPLLQHLMDNKCTLLDYEKITDASGRRLVFFGKFAGNAGMVDALWAAGQRYLQEYGLETPFLKIKQSYEYESLAECLKELNQVGEEIRKEGLPEEICPFNICLLGYGNVSIGCQEVLSVFPVNQVEPSELSGLTEKNTVINLAVFKEKDLVERKDGGEFSLNDYFVNGNQYKSKMERYLPYCSMYMNGIYWAPGYPVFLKNSELKKLQGEFPKLVMTGDITCDIEGSIEATRKATMPDNPVYIYNPETDEIEDGFKGRGFAICAIDNLPCEFSREASDFFSTALEPFMESMLTNDYTKPVLESILPEEIRKSCIVHRGSLEKDFEYLKDFLK